MRTRGAIGGIGLIAIGYGSWLLLSGSSFEALFSTGLWLAGGVVAHDVAVAGLALATGWLVVRRLPTWARGPVAVGGIALGSLTLLALPVLVGAGRRADNPSLLDRDYVTNWLGVLALVFAAVAAAGLVLRWRQSRGGDDGARAGGR